MSASVTARRFAATVLAAGAAVSAVTLPASAHDNDRHRPPRVEISAVQADSPGRDNRTTRSLNAEWVQITNTTRHAVNLTGWTLRDEDGHRYRFDHVRLAGRATVRIHTGTGHDTRTDLYQNRRAYMWNNRADTATLRDDHGRTVDTKSWGRGHHRR
ncbi:lamin tail domain-containing protein [Streptomyces sp. NPDC058439]|uniref:lamin tail domain-containing protein n=1 Tax=Streptomyces sp. NPDC058439 TaxID=3346500 RepID=UPI00365252DC